MSIRIASCRLHTGAPDAVTHAGDERFRMNSEGPYTARHSRASSMRSPRDESMPKT